MSENLITPETLSLYGSVRSIDRWDRHCTHWMGREGLPWTTEGKYFAFPTEGAALHWFNTGDLPATARVLTKEEAAIGCECHAKAVAAAGSVAALLHIEPALHS